MVVGKKCLEIIRFMNKHDFKINTIAERFNVTSGRYSIHDKEQKRSKPF